MIPLVNWPRPLMTGEQNDEISKIMTPVNTFVEEEAHQVHHRRP